MQQQGPELLKKQAKQNVKIPQALEETLDDFMDSVIELEKEEYHQDIVPFVQHEKQMRMRAKEFVTETLNQFDRAEKLLKQILEQEEKTNSTLPPEACFARWEEGFQKLKERMLGTEFEDHEFNTKSMQELAGIDWQLMDRAYAAGKKLAEQKRFEDAWHVFMCLKFVNPEVLEYWLNEATCLYELERYEEAFDAFSSSLMIESQNPFIFFQMANCLYQLQEIKSSVEALNLCIKYAELDPNYEELLKNAIHLKQTLENQKAA